MKKLNSFYDTRGYLYVDCTECTRGYFGDDIDKCCAGFKNKKPGMGCFIGTLKKDLKQYLK